MKNIPEPNGILEELADNILLRMDRSSTAGFRAALEEMITFHKFLLEAYVTHDEYGNAKSYAVLGNWRGVHRDWIAQYRRLFERAITYLDREPEFFSELTYVPYKLLMLESPETETKRSILDLGQYLVHRLEAWVTRKRSINLDEVGTASRSLAGSDKRIYLDALRVFVSGWESCLVAEWSGYQEGNQGAEIQWEYLKRKWEFSYKHLEATGYLLVAALWNDDEIAAEIYLDTLLRWFNGLPHDLRPEFAYGTELLSADLISYDWRIVQEKCGSSSAGLIGKPEPVFRVIAENTWRDVIVILAGIVLDWHISGKQKSGLIPSTLIKLLKADIDDSVYGNALKTNFDEFILTIVRIVTNLDRRLEGQYGKALERVVQTFDGMAEREVVSGRIYTPSVRHDLEDLKLPWLIICTALAPTSDVRSITSKASTLLSSPTGLPSGCRSYQAILSWCKDFEEMLRLDSVIIGISAIDKDADGEKSNVMREFLADLIASTQKQYTESLKAKPIDIAKFEKLKKQIDEEITDIGKRLLFADNLTIDDAASDVFWETKKISPVNKGNFVEPPMGLQISNLSESIAARIAATLVQLIVRKLGELKSTEIFASTEKEYLEKLRELSLPIKERGRRPILLTGDRVVETWISFWLQGKAPIDVTAEIRRRISHPRNGYIATVNGIDCYRAILEDVSILLPSDALAAIHFHRLLDGHLIALRYSDDGDPWEGTINVRLGISFEWRDKGITKIRSTT